MRIEFKLEADNPENAQIAIDKLFQVVFVDKPNLRNIRQIDIFTCLIYRAQNWNNGFPHLKFSLDVDGLKPKFREDLSNEFFRNINVIKQFWGEECRLIKSVEMFSDLVNKECNLEKGDSLTHDLEVVYKSLDKEEFRPVLIKEIDKNIQPFILLPQKSDFLEPDKIRIRPDITESVKSDQLGLKLSVGSWSHINFNAPLCDVKGRIPLEHQITWLPSGVKSDDFKIYYTFPSECDFLDQHSFIHAYEDKSLRNHTEIKIELNEVFSQPYTMYFSVWEKLGIKKSTLLRLHNSTYVDNLFKNGVVKFCFIHFRMLDTDIKTRRDTKILIKSIWLAALVAMGVDATRVIATKDFFPSTAYVNTLFWWILICASLIPMLIKPIKPLYPKLSKIFKSLNVIGFLSWGIIAFLLSESLKSSINATSFARYLVYIIVFSGFLTLVFQRCSLNWLKRIGKEVKRIWNLIF